MEKFIAKKKTTTEVVAILTNADIVFNTYSAKRVKAQSLKPKDKTGIIWIKKLIPDVIEAFDGELYLPSGYSAVFYDNKLFIKLTKETIHIWKISK